MKKQPLSAKPDFSGHHRIHHFPISFIIIPDLVGLFLDAILTFLSHNRSRPHGEDGPIGLPFQRNQPSRTTVHATRSLKKHLTSRRTIELVLDLWHPAVPAITLSPRGIGCAGSTQLEPSSLLQSGGSGEEPAAGVRTLGGSIPNWQVHLAQQFPRSQCVGPSCSWTDPAWTQGRGRAFTGRARIRGVLRWICPKIRWTEPRA